MKFLNKKGMDISLNFVILAVLALIALILVALFFTGGLTSLFADTEDVGDTSGEKLALYESECELYCTLGQQTSFEKVKYIENEGQSNEKTYTCTGEGGDEQLGDINWAEDCDN
jgi:hypothetical protein